MADTATATPPVETKPPFDPAAYIQKQNEKEAAERGGKPAAAAPAAAAPAAAEPAADSTPKLPKSVRRELNQLRRDLGEAQGKLAAYQELHAKGATAPAAAAPAAGATETAPAGDPKPLRKDYADDASFNEALSLWSGAQAANKRLADAEQQQRMQQEVQSKTEKAIKDSEAFEDWADVAKRANEADTMIVFNAAEEPDWKEESEDGKKTVGITVDFTKHPLFLVMRARSDYQAALDYHLAQHPEELWKLLKQTEAVGKRKDGSPISRDEGGAIANFHQLEGEVRVLYREKRKTAAQAGSTAAPKTATSPETGPRASASAKETKLPRPTESVSVPSGSTPDSKPSPYLADGKTVNPAWLAARNDRDGRPK